MQDVEKQVMSVKLMEAKIRQQLNWGDGWDYQSTDINHRECNKWEKEGQHLFSKQTYKKNLDTIK